MLFRMSLSNIKGKLRDYAIYFFTLIIGVSIFYVFNAIGGQAAMMQVASSNNSIVVLLNTSLSVVSYFVAVVLALLIVYASRFLMKRRNREFGLYMCLGMGKGKISMLLFFETVLIGIFSLAGGIILGIGLSQVMSALVAALFEADMTAYKLTVSVSAIGKTVLYFAVMYLAVMLLNGFSVTKMKLIDLLASDKKSESVKAKSPAVCIPVFILSACGLAWAYITVAVRYKDLSQGKLVAAIIMGMVTTFFIFWSVSGMLLKIVMSSKKLYYKELNAFTFRQISSKINTVVFSMTVICLMLFVTICTLSAAFSVRNSMNKNLLSLCPVDVQVEFLRNHTKKAADADISIKNLYEHYGFDVNEGISEDLTINVFEDPDFTLGDSFGSYLKTVKENYRFLTTDEPQSIVSISDYNALMRLYGKEELSLNEGEYILLCDYKTMKNLRDAAFGDGGKITVFGKDLTPKYKECVDGFVNISAQHINPGLYLVPDSVVEGKSPYAEIFSANYEASGKEEKKAADKEFTDRFNEIRAAAEKEKFIKDTRISINTKVDIFESAIGLGAILTFLGLYIGLVFLIASGAILALKELSESVDSVSRYEMLRKIGADEEDINKSLFRQAFIFFSLPLILAVIHSVFGMQFAIKFLEVFGTEGTAESVGITSVILLVIYGGYFIITYVNSKWIISEK
ncbi:MAG: ABC transporter permease [Lachnospiraceae bacterium]|nr:ABC transporter permease [Lachnospiraceae bacterium]